METGSKICYLIVKSEFSIDRNRNLLRQEYIDFFGTGAGMELFCDLPEQEFRLTA